MKRILVGVDGSDASAAALGWAGRLARVNGAEVVVAHVFQPDQAELPPKRYDELRWDAERCLETEWVAPLRRVRRRSSKPSPHRSPRRAARRSR